MLRYYRRSALPLGLSKNLLFILVLPPILFRHFQKFSKLLHPLSLHLPCIHHLPIRLQPVQHIMLLYPMTRWITMVGLNEFNHLVVSHQPPLVLCHLSLVTVFVVFAVETICPASFVTFILSRTLPSLAYSNIHSNHSYNPPSTKTLLQVYQNMEYPLLFCLFLHPFSPQKEVLS